SKGTVPAVTNGGFGDTTGTVPFREERLAVLAQLGSVDQGQPGQPDLSLWLVGGRFGVQLIHAIYLAKFLQKFWITVVETSDLPEFRAVACLVLYNFSPDFDFAKQQCRPANGITILLLRPDDAPK